MNTPPITSDVPLLPPRDPATHKGQVGRVAIIAGSRGMSGAACLAGLGALRGGAGLVRVYTAESVQPLVAASEPGMMTVGLQEDVEGRIVKIEDTGWATVAAIGPGLGTDSTLPAVVARLAAGFAGPVVIDADGLNNLATVPNWWTARAKQPTIITPHPGEMARLRTGAGLPPLFGNDDDARLRCAHEYARLTSCVVVLKGYRTVVSTPTQAYINTTGNPGMATGGMGDVLTGLLAALLGQGFSAFDAARLGGYAHGLAADLCAKEIGPVGYLAREVADSLPAALARCGHGPVGFRRAN